MVTPDSFLRDDPNEFGGNFLDMLTVEHDVNRA